MQDESRLKKSATQPVVRISRGHFAPEKYDEVKRLLAESAIPLGPAILALEGLLYFHAGLDANTNTIVNVSIWETEQAARQMDTLAPMLAQRKIMETAGMQFDKNANYETIWTLAGRGPLVSSE
jgi:hypothetical protein